MQDIRANLDEVRSVNNNVKSEKDIFIKQKESLVQNLEELNSYVLSSNVKDLIGTIRNKNYDITNAIVRDLDLCSSFLESRMDEYAVSEEETSSRIITSINKMNNITQGILSSFKA